ncbi:protein-L-isoaspartate O-methyltransferase family protein [Garicola koreensis]|uniref:Protein-L-isoaspartate O-methyltransferase n=1 Tax=Garicola koreensis TaxID=1262554 RepID=A0A7W5XJT0_9MICC|nr:protein-L-isoaspartate O-methyltransferase [Garicola koreensis]MBB3666707.1 protein-L-isoaspartate(D-aspartate) O-methyltransferase [Garicola koreensis]
MRRDDVDDPVAAAFAAVAREDFLPDEVRGLAAEDQPVPLGHGQTNSQPRTVANMLRLLGAQPGHRVLDVGAGSGWSTALLGHIVGETGAVLGTELVPELTQDAAGALGKYPMSWVRVRQADPEVLGAPDEAPFDRILVSAEAAELPDQLVAQLAEGGTMVIPVRSQMLHVEKRGEDIVTTRHGPYSFVPLR